MSPARPPCLRKLASPWAAFQASTGTVAPTASMTARQGSARRSQARVRADDSSHTAMIGTSSRAVYLESKPSPEARPAPSSQAVRPVRWARPRQNRAAVQNRISGVSGVIVTAPTPAISVAFSNSAATAARNADRPSRSRATWASRNDPASAASGASSRTPSASSPAIAVPARIQSATIGG